METRGPWEKPLRLGESRQRKQQCAPMYTIFSSGGNSEIVVTATTEQRMMKTHGIH